MLRPFGDTTLLDLVLAKLAELGPDSFFAGFEHEFEEKSRQHGVRFVRRDERSVSIDEPITDILSFLRGLDYTHFLIVNGCLPFLEVDTIRDVRERCIAGGHEPAFAVVRRHNHFIGPDRTPLNFPRDMKTINSKTVTPVFEFAHALYFFEKQYFFEHGAYWDWRTVRFLELSDRAEILDIDTEEDFTFAETVWRGRLQAG